MQSSMSQWLQQEQLAAVAKSPFFGLSVDEATDVSTTKQLIVFIRYLKRVGHSMVPVTEFLAMVEVDDGTAAGLHIAVKKLLNEHKLLACECIKKLNRLFAAESPLRPSARRLIPPT
jgi:hypothetical protein